MPKEPRRHDQTHGVYSRLLNGEEQEVNETKAGVAACQVKVNIEHRGSDAQMSRERERQRKSVARDLNDRALSCTVSILSIWSDVLQRWDSYQKPTRPPLNRMHPEGSSCLETIWSGDHSMQCRIFQWFHPILANFSLSHV